MFCFFLYIRLLSDNRKDKKKRFKKHFVFDLINKTSSISPTCRIVAP